ncbi:unnamed protein product [Gordionus sp. m RMFG-2023]
MKETGRIIPTADLSLRINSNPAGTARHYVAHVFFKRMVRSNTIVLVPDLYDFKTLKEKITEIDKYPAIYHIGFAYLCEGVEALKHKIEFDDNDGNKYIEKTGTYGEVVMKASTLMQSPHYKNELYKSDEDYSSDYAKNLREYINSRQNEGFALIWDLGWGRCL